MTYKMSTPDTTTTTIPTIVVIDGPATASDPAVRGTQVTTLPPLSPDLPATGVEPLSAWAAAGMVLAGIFMVAVTRFSKA